MIADESGLPEHVVNMLLVVYFVGIFLYYSVHYHVRNNPPLIPVFSHTNPINTPRSYITEALSVVILSSTNRYFKGP
jgi:hypothetical protein